MATGRVKRVVLDRGFGFIAPDDGPKGIDVFFHVTGLATGLAFDEQLTEMEVAYELKNVHGRLRATDIKPPR